MDGDEPIEEPFTWRRAPVLLSDRLGLRPSGLIGAVLAVAAAGIGAWFALRPPPPPPEETLPFVQQVASPAPAAVGPATADVVVVHVDGAVRFPGVHELSAGSRVGDAVAAAGGLTPVADRRQINLAQVVADGQRIWVPIEGEEIEVVIGAGGDATSPGGGVVALSTAPPGVLESLPGIGPSLAAAIVDHRDREGPFVSVDELLEVPGIGPAKLEALRDLVAP